MYEINVYLLFVFISPAFATGDNFPTLKRASECSILAVHQ